MRQAKIKPCPFCRSDKFRIDRKKGKYFFTGADARIEKHTYSVRCNSCFARGGVAGGNVIMSRRELIPKDRLSEFVTDGQLIDRAIENWNNRKCGCHVRDTEHQN